MMLLKCCIQICQQIWKTQQWSQDWKRSVFIPVPKTGNKLWHNCTHFTYQQGNAQNPSSLVSMIHELRTSRCRSWIQKRQRNQRSNFQHPLDYRKSKGIPNISFINYAKAFDCVNCNKLWKILKEMRIPDHLTCLLRNLYTGQEATVRSRHGRMDWFQFEKGVVKAVYCHSVYLT